jgi:hypothetical protein
MMAKRSKYGNRKCVLNGMLFDSILERDRYLFLIEQQKLGFIKRLARQEKFTFQINGIIICNYIADFSYRLNGVEITEDAKGVKTAVFNLKAKLFRSVYGYDIQVIDRANVTNLVPVKKKRKKTTVAE